MMNEMRKRKTAIDCIVSLAESEGLSYGQYAAREHPVTVERRILDIDKPRGLSTIQAALRVDCPRSCGVIDKSKPKVKAPRPALKPKEPPIDEAVELYKQGYTITDIADKLGRPKQNIAARLRRAGYDVKAGPRGLPAEKVLKIRSLRAEGRSFRDIAFECNVSEASVKKYLKIADK